MKKWTLRNNITNEETSYGSLTWEAAWAFVFLMGVLTGIMIMT